MIDHPSSEELAAFVRGGLASQRTREVVRHLLLPCPPCGALVAEAMGKVLNPEPVNEDEYDEPIERAFKTVLDQRRRTEAERLEKLLADNPLATIPELPWETDKLALLDSLLARSWAERRNLPSLMVMFADMAVMHSGTLDACVHGVREVADLQCRALAELGNAHRVADNLKKAAATLTQARRLCELGTGDKDLEIRVTELEGSLAADRGLYSVAHIKLTRVHGYYKRKGDEHLAGRALILRGLYANYEGETETALQLLREGRSMIDPERDPDLVYCAAHNELLCLTDAGFVDEAKRLRLRRSRDLALGEGRVHEVRLQAIDGRLDAAEGKHERAEATFREVKEGFGELGRRYHAGIASLDLAAVLLRQNRWEEAKEEALAAIRIFLRHNLGPEAYAAVILLRESLELGIADAARVQDVADFLRRAENDPYTPHLPPPLPK